MLQGEQAVIRQFGRLRVAKHAEHAAVMFGVNLLLHRRAGEMQQGFTSSRKR
jgi:hypothetical protein